MSERGGSLTDPDELVFLHGMRRLSPEVRAAFLTLPRGTAEQAPAPELRTAVPR